MADGDNPKHVEKVLKTHGFGFHGVNPHVFFTNKQHYLDSLKFSSVHCRFFDDGEITDVKFFHPEKNASTSPIYKMLYLQSRDILPSNVYVKWMDPLSLEEDERETIKSVEESLHSIQLYSLTSAKPVWTYHPGPIIAKNQDTGVIGKEVRKYMRLYNIQLHKQKMTIKQLEKMTIKKLDSPEDQNLVDMQAELTQQNNAMSSICSEVEKHHHRAMAFLLANAFYNQMHNSEGKAGIVAFFEVAVELIDSTRLTIYCHGGSAKDAHGFNIVELNIAALKEENAIEGAREPPLAAASAVTPNTFAVTPDTGGDSSAGSRSISSSIVTPPSKRKRMASSSTGSEVRQRGSSHNDITIFSVSDSEIIPVLLVEIKSNGSKSLSSVDENQFVRYLLGALQFKDEAYGILINCAVARMYKMYKTVKDGKPTITYSYKEYVFPTFAEDIEAQYRVFDTEKLIDLFRDILLLLTYLLPN